MIRDASRDDVPTMFDVRLSVRENAATRDGLEREGINEKTVVASLATDSHGWIAEDGGKSVGFTIADGHEGSIFALFVLPEFEGRGHGEALLDAAVEWLLDREFERLWLEVRSGTRAHRFYRKRGWADVGVAENGDIRMEFNRNQKLESHG
jgi:ribosomal protein S18 acetylase RimI-like enzyme